MNNFGDGKKTRLSRVYFVWTIRDFGSAECQNRPSSHPPTIASCRSCVPRVGADESGFHSLLQAIEAEDTEGRIEIHIYLTAKIEQVHFYPYPCYPCLNFFPVSACSMISPSSCVMSLPSSEDKMNNILVNDVGAEQDAITSLRAPTHFGRPNVSPRPRPSPSNIRAFPLCLPPSHPQTPGEPYKRSPPLPLLHNHKAKE